jgi:hypothetical protein
LRVPIDTSGSPGVRVMYIVIRNIKINIVEIMAFYFNTNNISIPQQT